MIKKYTIQKNMSTKKVKLNVLTNIFHKKCSKIPPKKVEEFIAVSSNCTICKILGSQCNSKHLCKFSYLAISFAFVSIVNNSEIIFAQFWRSSNSILHTPPNFRICVRRKVPAKHIKICHHRGIHKGINKVAWN